MAFMNLGKEGGQNPMQRMAGQGMPQPGPYQGYSQSPPPMPGQAPPPPPMPEPMQSAPNFSDDAPTHTADVGERIEELAEAIIDEKWKELSRSIDKVIEWKEKTEATINKIEEDFQILKSDFENLHSAVLGKVGEYDQHIMTLGSEIKAMEKVFQKILPTFTENVSELSKITKTLKARK